MNIILEQPYKSLSPFRWDNVADLSIITGLNGVGKSQIIEVIASAYYNRNGYIVFEDFNIVQNGISVWSQMYGIGHLHSISFSYHGLDFLVNAIYDECVLSKNINRNGSESYINNFMNKYPNETNYEIRNMMGRFFHVIVNQKIEIGNYVRDKVGKDDISKVTREDISNHIPVSLFMRDKDLSRNDGTEFIFYMYLFNVVARSKRGLVTDGPTPWEVLNEVIISSGLPYRVIEPDISEMEKIFDNPFSRLENKLYKIELIDINTGTVIQISDLSSGEKILMSLALTLFYTQEVSGHRNIMLLDEPDAHLHPSMTRQLFKVIYEVLIKKYGMKIIMTTHSASTIALAPEVDDCVIYTIKKNPTIIEKILSKSSVIDLLTEGLVLVTPSTKYVLIEGKDDKTFYEAVYRKIMYDGLLSKDMPLAFVAGTGKGSVNHWSQGLRNAGLGEVVKGIIDKDNDNSISDGIYRLERYSIENYMLDPVLVFCAGNKIPDVIPNFGIQRGEEERVKILDQEKIQSICDAIFNYAKPNIPNSSSLDGGLVLVEYSNGMILSYPRWFLNHRGKDLFGVFFNCFGNNLSKESLSQALKRTGLIPKDLVAMFRDVQS